MQILRILKHFIFIRKTIFFNNRHTYLHSSARSLRPLTVICLPRERRCGKHLQRMLDKCTGGGIKWPRAVYSSLLHKVVAKTFCIFCRVIWIFANLAETLTAWFQSIKVASFVKKKQSFSYLAPTVWNGLPLDIRLSPTFDTFKRRLKTRLFKADQHPHHASHLVTASASDSVSLLNVRAL